MRACVLETHQPARVFPRACVFRCAVSRTHATVEVIEFVTSPIPVAYVIDTCYACSVYVDKWPFVSAIDFSRNNPLVID